MLVTAYAEWYSTDITIQRFHNEVHVHSLLHKDVDVVPLVGVYSTEAHPFGLIYEYMDGLDLKQYLRNQPNVERAKVVLVPLHSLSPSDLICRS